MTSMLISKPATKEGIMVVVEQGGSASRRAKQAQAHPRKAELTGRQNGALIVSAEGGMISMWRA